MKETAENKYTDPNKATVLVKLTKSRGFGRGDFIVLQGPGSGINIFNIAIADANPSDKGREHQIGEFFHLTNYPVNQQYATDEHWVNAPTRKVIMVAQPLHTEADKIDETSTVAPANMVTVLKNIVSMMMSGLKQQGTACQLAPVSLKDAVTKLKSTGNSKFGGKYKSLPPNGDVAEDPDTKIRTFLGAHIEYDETGGINISANNKGLIVDKDGNIDHQGNTSFRESPGEPHTLAGIPTTKSMFSDIRPNTFIMPVGLGPLALDRIPDFSVLNWAIKVFDTVSAVGDLVVLIDKYNEEKNKAQEMMDEYEAAGLNYEGPKSSDIHFGDTVNAALDANVNNNIEGKIQ